MNRLCILIKTFTQAFFFAPAFLGSLFFIIYYIHGPKKLLGFETFDQFYQEVFKFSENPENFIVFEQFINTIDAFLIHVIHISFGFACVVVFFTFLSSFEVKKDEQKAD